MLSNPSLRPCLIVLTAQDASAGEGSTDKGMKVSQLAKLRKTLNSFNIEWKIATFGGNKAGFNYERGEGSRDWIKDNQLEFNNPLTFEKINPAEYSGNN